MMSPIKTKHLFHQRRSLNYRSYVLGVHIFLYLYFNNNHPSEHKRGVVKTLMHRVDTIVSLERDKVEEKSHVKHALNMNGYPD